MNKSIVFFSFFLFCIPAIFPTINAKYVELDDFLKQRADKAIQAALSAYNPNPESVTETFNKEVGAELLRENGTRRHLQDVDDCKATNPIDGCWRCRSDWATDRKRLAECARGFGYRTTGGYNGKIYIVTDPSDNDYIDPKPGTLRYGAIQDEPLWIIFAKSMIIKLERELLVTSDKTIDGRGVNVHIANGAGITIQFVSNVIIHNIRIYNIVKTSGGFIRDSTFHLGHRTTSDGDGISIYGSSNIWIDHVSLANCYDGLIDAIMSSTAITISNCKFNRHNDVMLLGAHDWDDMDSIMQVTVAFNRFGKGLVQRMPRCRWGFFHVVNNDYNQWEKYAIGGSAHPTIISQGNRFRASNDTNTKEVTKRSSATEDEWKNWQWRSEGDLFKNGAFFVESGPPIKQSPLSKRNMINAKPGNFVGLLTRNAGQWKCKAGKPC